MRYSLFTEFTKFFNQLAIPIFFGWFLAIAPSVCFGEAEAQENLPEQAYLEVQSNDNSILSATLLEGYLPRQVFIESALIEVTYDDRLDLGINWNYVQTDAFGSSGFNAEDSNINLPVLDVPLGSNFPVGLDIIGRVLRLERGDINVNIEAFLAKTKSKLLANPSITTIVGKEATIKTGQRIPYVMTIVVKGRDVEVTKFFDTGITLKVTPTGLSEDGDYVQLSVNPTVTKVIRTKLEKGKSLPVLSTRQVSTVVIVKSGEPFVLGGLYLENTVETKRRIPVVSKVPILGWAFKSRNTAKMITELIIYLRPVILYPEDQFFPEFVNFKDLQKEEENRASETEK